MKSRKRLARAKNERILLLFVAKEVFRTERECEKSVVLGFRVRESVRWLFVKINSVFFLGFWLLR